MKTRTQRVITILPSCSTVVVQLDVGRVEAGVGVASFAQSHKAPAPVSITLMRA